MARLTLKAITRQIAMLQAKAERVRKREKKPALQNILRLMRAHDISVNELRGVPVTNGKVHKGASPLKGRKAKPMYRNSKTGETWSGRGRAARWIVTAEKAGKKREQFLVAKN
jgi:DNA-binding protein H-NS